MRKTARRPFSPLLFVKAAGGPVRPKKSRKVSISTIVILALAAIAAIAYYVGTPPTPTSVAATADPCLPGDPQIVIPQGVNTSYQVPKLTVVVGVNNTIGWDDQDTTYLHVVSSESVPPGSDYWDFNMTAGQSDCVTLTVLGSYGYEIGFSPITYFGQITVKAAS